jgi:hypothetical protein
MLSPQVDAATTIAGAAEAADPSYALALRVIGQDLSPLFPRVLEIETDGKVFEARGERHPNPFETIREGFLARTWNKLRGIAPAQPAEATTSFSRRYEAAEVERLDQLNRAHRLDDFRRADIYSLAERLRTMGAIVDGKNGRLKHLRKNADHLVVEYWDRQNQLQSAKLTSVILYRNQQQLDQQRRSGPSELWEGYDF